MRKLLVLLAALVLISGCVTQPITSTGEQILESSNSISIDGTSFLPNRLEVSRGEPVTFFNMGNTVHTITSGYVVDGNPVSDGIFSSGDMGSMESWAHTFTRDGVYRFYCSRHPDMQGVIIVADDGESIISGHMITNHQKQMIRNEKDMLVEIRSSMFESSSPSHLQKMVSAPETVSVTFTKTLLPGSYIRVYDTEYGTIPVSNFRLSGDWLTMSAGSDELTEGTYKTEYKAVFEDGTYGFGEFYFIIGGGGPSITVASMEPSSGVANGGTPVIVKGSGFQEGARAWFHHIYAQSTEFIDSNTLRVVTPRHFVTETDVRIDNPDGTYGNFCCFTYR